MASLGAWCWDWRTQIPARPVGGAAPAPAGARAERRRAGLWGPGLAAGRLRGSSPSVVFFPEGQRRWAEETARSAQGAARARGGGEAGGARGGGGGGGE